MSVGDWSGLCFEKCKEDKDDECIHCNLCGKDGGELIEEPEFVDVKECEHCGFLACFGECVEKKPEGVIDISTIRSKLESLKDKVRGE